MPPDTGRFHPVTVAIIGSVRTIDRYEIGRLLGTGNFATVHAAIDPALDAPVAIKLLAENHSADPELRERFVREARLQRRAASERIVTIHDVGEHDGRPYLVMQLVDGGTLADRWPEAPVPTAIVLRIIDELEACLAALHAAGIVHRDIKPSNLLVSGSDESAHGVGRPLLSEDESLILGDLGLARDLAASNLTAGVGTSGWMAPEQSLPSAEVDHRADLHAATMIVATLITGSPPNAVPHRIADLPNAVRDELRSGLAAEPRERPSDAAAWASGLRRSFDTPDARQTVLPPRRRPIVVGAIVALVVAALAIAWSVGRGGDVDKPAIVGPRNVAVGEEVIFATDADPDELVVWIDWTGERHERDELRIIAERPGRLPIAVSHQSEDGEVATTSIEIVVSG